MPRKQNKKNNVSSHNFKINDKVIYTTEKNKKVICTIKEFFKPINVKDYPYLAKFQNCVILEFKDGGYLVTDLKYITKVI